MPEHNPLVEQDPGHSGGLFNYLDPRPIFLASPVAPVNPQAAGVPQQTNAAGSDDNVALHTAFIVAFALVGVYVLRASGFKFVVAGSIGS